MFSNVSISKQLSFRNNQLEKVKNRMDRKWDKFVNDHLPELSSADIIKVRRESLCLSI